MYVLPDPPQRWRRLLHVVRVRLLLSLFRLGLRLEEGLLEHRERRRRAGRLVARERGERGRRERRGTARRERAEPRGRRGPCRPQQRAALPPRKAAKKLHFQKNK